MQIRAAERGKAFQEKALARGRVLQDYFHIPSHHHKMDSGFLLAARNFGNVAMYDSKVS